MTDPRLVTYVRAVTVSHENALRMLREQSKKGDSWIGFECPEVTLAIPGMIVSGKVVSHLEYLKRVRDAITAAEGGEDSRKIMSNLFKDPDLPSESDPPTEIERIYLIDVVIISGGERLNAPQFCIQLDSVQGWTLGKYNS